MSFYQARGVETYFYLVAWLKPNGDKKYIATLILFDISILFIFYKIVYKETKYLINISRQIFVKKQKTLI